MTLSIKETDSKVSPLLAAKKNVRNFPDIAVSSLSILPSPQWEMSHVTVSINRRSVNKTGRCINQPAPRQAVYKLLLSLGKQNSLFASCREQFLLVRHIQE